MSSNNTPTDSQNAYDALMRHGFVPQYGFVMREPTVHRLPFGSPVSIVECMEAVARQIPLMREKLDKMPIRSVVSHPLDVPMERDLRAMLELRDDGPMVYGKVVINKGRFAQSEYLTFEVVSDAEQMAGYRMGRNGELEPILSPYRSTD